MNPQDATAFDCPDPPPEPRTWITIFDTGIWHVGERKELKIANYKFWAARCTGRQIGGAWGPRTRQQDWPPGRVCARCAKIIAKEGAL